MRKFIERIIAALARATVKKFQPKVIGVTGTAGKTSTKDAIFTVLRAQFRVRRNEKNYNTDLGLGMTVLGDWDEVPESGRVAIGWFWFKVMCFGMWQLIKPGARDHYPEVLILEYAADRPGDIRRLLTVVKPEIAVLTAIGDIPVHIEFYENVEGVASEKGTLINALHTKGVAVVNADDERALSLTAKTSAKVITFGFSDAAQMKIVSFENKAELEPGGVVQTSIHFKLEMGEKFVPLRISGTLGKTQAYAAAAAAAVAGVLGVNLVKVADAFYYHQAPQHRMQCVRGISDSLVIDDSYNASPLAMHSAFDTLKDISAKRKIAIIGDMRELGRYSHKAHEEVGTHAAKVIDLLMVVGNEREAVASAAHKAGLAKKNILTFAAVEDLIPKVRDLIKPQDFILIKASKAVGLKKVAELLKA